MFVTFTFWNYYVLKLLHFETITFSDATLSDINVLLCYILSQYSLSSANIDCTFSQRDGITGLIIIFGGLNNYVNLCIYNDVFPYFLKSFYLIV